MRTPVYTLVYHNISTEGYASYAQEFFDDFAAIHYRMEELNLRGINCYMRRFRNMDWILFRGHITEEDYSPDLYRFT